MATQYRTKQGDRLDDICNEYYGTPNAIHVVLEANPGLAENGTIYDEGIKIILPDYSEDTVGNGDAVLWS